MYRRFKHLLKDSGASSSNTNTRVFPAFDSSSLSSNTDICLNFRFVMEPIDFNTSDSSESGDWDLPLYKALLELEYSAASSSNTDLTMKSHYKEEEGKRATSCAATIEERDFYLKIEAESRSQFKAYDAAGTVALNYENIGSMLQRLRQACQHPLLVNGFDSDLVFQNGYISSKIRASLEIIRSHDSSSQGPIKAIIFSQETRMLELVEMSLSQLCIQYRRLDGSMSPVSRDTAVKEFNSDPQVVIMLMSIKPGKGVDDLNGVSLEASHVILLDVWWDPDTEDEAIDRAHRIVQTRPVPVTVSRVTIKDTVEDRILAIQEELRKFSGVFFNVHESLPGLTIHDLRYLFMGIR